MAFKSKRELTEETERITSAPSFQLKILMDDITSSVADKIWNLPSLGSYRGRSIYKVPQRLRKLNEETYTPKLVSIGPLHHGRPHLTSMERYKLEYCKKFLVITKMDLSELIDHAMEWEEEVYQHYVDTVAFSSKEFVEIFVLDGLFIIMLFLKEKFPQTFAYNDVIYANQWILRELLHDMMLLENQLPSYVLEKLLDMVPQELPENITFSELTHHYFSRHVENIDRVPIVEPCMRRHLVEYLHTYHPMYFHIQVDPSTQKFEYPRSATELYAAGIKFVRSPEPCMLEIEFTSNGELRIQQLKVNDWTETLFRNPIAFEQCDHQPEYISSYIIFLGRLINTPMDVDLLAEYKIIKNLLSDSERVSDLFNNLYEETFTEYSIFYYADICHKLNAYSKNYWHRWRWRATWWRVTRYRWRAAWSRWYAILKKDYFSSPWTIISVIAAIVLLLLMVAQTWCSFMACSSEK